MDLGQLWDAIIKGNAGISDKEFVRRELQRFMNSKERKNILTGRKYYEGIHDIINKKRTMAIENTAIVGSGQNEIPLNLPNNQLVDNKFDDLVDQKVNYLFGNPMEVKTDDEGLIDLLGKKFHRQLLNVAKDAYIGGKGYLHPYIDSKNELAFKRFKPENVIPYWRDEEHNQLNAFIYFYDVEQYHLLEKTHTVQYVEFHKPNGVMYFIYNNGTLTVNTDKETTNYIIYEGKEYNWPSVPLLVFKANSIEQPLINRVKSLQDALNEMYSMFLDRLQEDPRETLIVLRNYDGTDLAEFRRMLAKYGAVKVRDDGGIETLNIEVNAINYDFITQALKRSIIENGRGFDAKDDRMANNPNQMNISSMYSDIDLDANQIEVEFQATLEQLVEFYHAYRGLSNATAPKDVEFIFNRMTPVNEGEVINNCKASIGILSNETIVANHPWTANTAEELERLQQERLQMMQEMALQDYIVGGGDEPAE